MWTRGTPYSGALFFDSHLLSSSTAYRYSIRSEQPGCAGIDCDDANMRTALTVTNPGPAPVARGRLVSTDHPDGNFRIESCDECQGGLARDVSVDAAPYVDSGVELVAYGYFEHLDCERGWIMVVSEVEPLSCAVGVEAATWTTVKHLYR